jgi:hypothetical protein
LEILVSELCSSGAEVERLALRMLWGRIVPLLLTAQLLHLSISPLLRWCRYNVPDKSKQWSVDQLMDFDTVEQFWVSSANREIELVWDHIAL